MLQSDLSYKSYQAKTCLLMYMKLHCCSLPKLQPRHMTRPRNVVRDRALGHRCTVQIDCQSSRHFALEVASLDVQIVCRTVAQTNIGPFAVEQIFPVSLDTAHPALHHSFCTHVLTDVFADTAVGIAQIIERGEGGPPIGTGVGIGKCQVGGTENGHILHKIHGKHRIFAMLDVLSVGVADSVPFLACYGNARRQGVHHHGNVYILIKGLPVLYSFL